MTADRDDLAAIGQQIITDYALDHESLHANWRCEHPDVYGPCGCVDEFLTSLAQMVLESDWLRGELDKAWCNGYHAGDCGEPDNPYRADRVDADERDRLQARIDKALALVEQWEAARDYWSDVANETEDVEKRLRQLAVASRYSDQITTLRAALAADTPTGTINDDDQEARR